MLKANLHSYTAIICNDKALASRSLLENLRCAIPPHGGSLPRSRLRAPL